MAYCQNCGATIDTNANFCPSCGAAQNGTNAQTQNAHHSDTAKTVATAAGTALGVSMLSRKLHRRRRPPMPPHGGMMGGPMMGGHRGRGPRGGGHGGIR